MGRGKESLYKWSRSHDQDGHHAHIYGKKPSKIFSYRTNSPIIMKLGMKHYVLKLYKVYINDDPELTLTHFKTVSNLAKLGFVLNNSRPRYQVSVYRTIGPLVLP